MSSYDRTSSRLLTEAQNARRAASGYTATIASNLRDSGTGSDGRSEASKQQLKYTNPTTPTQDRPSFADIFDGVDRSNEIVARVDSQMDSWIAKYFPGINSGFGDMPESILAQIFSGGGPGGFVSTRFAQVFTRAKDRAFRTAQSAKDTAKADFTRRGFSLPQAAVARAMNEADLQAQDVLAQVNVDILNKDADLQADLLKHAIEQASRYKQAMLAIAVDFAKIWVNLPDQELERAKVKAQAQTSLYQALTAYHQIEVAFEQVRLSAASEQLRSDTTIEQVKAADRNSNDNAAAALGDAVNGLSSIAAAAYSSAGSLVAQIEST